MFTLVAHAEAQDPAAAVVGIAALEDDHVFTTGDDLRVPELSQLVLIAAGQASGGLGAVRVESPSLRRRHRLWVQPINGNADGDPEPGSPPAVLDYRQTPVKLSKDEILQAFTDSNPTAAALEWVGYWLADGPITAVKGDMFTARFTGTTTLTADVWSTFDPTFADTLPVGRYQIVGMRVQSAGACLARLIFRGTGQPWRPGVLGCDADADLDWPGFRFGGMGVFGEFHSTQPPRIEILSNAADTAEEGAFDLIQVG